MGLIVNLDKDGHLVYDGFLSSKEKASVDEVLSSLQQEIPQIEKDLSELYGKSVLYKYNLGLFLGELLEKYSITSSERRRFWDEIKDLASSDTRKRQDGKDSAVRSFFEQCYVLSQIDKATVEKLSWRQWQDLLDRTSNREDVRIYDWIKRYPEKIKEKEWREFEKNLHAYLKDKDTSVFSDEKLFGIYDSLLAMGKYWLSAFDDFAKNNPKSNKVKTKAKRSKKYIDACLRLRRERKQPLNEDIFSSAFLIAMK